MKKPHSKFSASMYKNNANKWNILVIFCKTHAWDQQNIKHPDPRLQKKKSIAI